MIGKVLLLVEAVQHLHTDDSPSTIVYDVILTERCLVLLQQNSDADRQLFSLADVTCFLSRDADDVMHVHVTKQDGPNRNKVRILHYKNQFEN